jgi:hypothetical protein
MPSADERIAKLEETVATLTDQVADLADVLGSLITQEFGGEMPAPGMGLEWKPPDNEEELALWDLREARTTAGSRS